MKALQSLVNCCLSLSIIEFLIVATDLPKDEERVSPPCTRRSTLVTVD